MTRRIERALISVSDKSGIEGFARLLSQMGVEILSTGGTFRALRGGGVPVSEVSDYTGFPEMMDGRVKTLHPKVHGGILALRDAAEHVASMREHSIDGIDLVVVNLYPFEETVAREGVTRAEAVEQIDIGGPSMVRSAAKNHRFVTVITDPADYGAVVDEMQRLDGGVSDALRRRLARKAFALTARYDAAIASWLHRDDLDAGVDEARFPESFALGGGEGARPALRREPAPARRVLSAQRVRRAQRRHGGRPLRQGALVQQPRRPRRRPLARQGVRRAFRVRHQAHQPVWGGRGRDRRGGSRGGLDGGPHLGLRVGPRPHATREPRMRRVPRLG